MRKSYQPVTITAEHRRRTACATSADVVPVQKRHPASAEPSWIIGAMSWLGSAILEGFALYGQSVGPCWFDPPGDYDAQAKNAQGSAPAPSPRESPGLRLGRSSHDIDIHAWLRSASASSHLTGNDRRWFRLVGVCPRRCAASGKRSSCDRQDVPHDLSVRCDIVDPHEVSLTSSRFGRYR